MSGDQMTRNTSIGTAMAKYPAEHMTEKILSTVSEEIGIEQSQLSETGSFVDMGVDSLMSLSITGRIREELDLDLPTTFLSIILALVKRLWRSRLCWERAGATVLLRLAIAKALLLQTKWTH